MSDDIERRFAGPSYGRLFVQSFDASSNDFTNRLIAAVCAKPFTIYSERYFFTKRINVFILHITTAGKESCQQPAEKHNDMNGIQFGLNKASLRISSNGMAHKQYYAFTLHIDNDAIDKMKRMPCTLSKNKTW